MLIDENGTPLTQREIPKMSLFKTSLQPNGVAVTFNGESVTIPFTVDDKNTIKDAAVWGQGIRTIEVDPSLSVWFSERLDVACKLVFFPEEWERPVDGAYQINNEHVSLADGYPLLVIGQASLDDLNSRLTNPLPMNRFRPNLVFEGGEPFAEDGWHTFTIGKNKFAAVKPCSRCIMTTTDQETAIRSAEPLKTLASYRKKNNKIYFGQNILVLDAVDEIRVGEEIEVRSVREKVFQA